MIHKEKQMSVEDMNVILKRQCSRYLKKDIWILMNDEQRNISYVYFRKY